jgi:hypothetical protein
MSRLLHWVRRVRVESWKIYSYSLLIFIFIIQALDLDECKDGMAAETSW